MDHQGRFRRAALAAGFSHDEISRFVDHLRLSIRLSASSGGVPVGQFGGLPRLPVDEEWPSNQARQLPFVFSVDWAALPKIDGFGLPADGGLLFFLDHKEDYLARDTGERGYARVIHVPADVETTIVEPADSGIVGERYDLSATLFAELPDWFAAHDEEDEDDLSPFQQQVARDLERDLPHLNELRALADDLWPADGGLASARIGGYADDAVLTSIAEQTLAGREKAGEIVIPVAKWFSHVAEEKHRLSGEWLSLARFPVADDFYYGGFVIRRDDLAAGRLDQALSVTEFSE
jgi:hypothetical protein